MWFNSKQRAEPYQDLTWGGRGQRWLFPQGPPAQVLHGCRQLVSLDVGLSPATSATLAFSCQRVGLGTLKELPVTSRRKVGMTSSPHGPYVLGYTRATMAVTAGSQVVRPSGSRKAVSVQIALCNSGA